MGARLTFWRWSRVPKKGSRNEAIEIRISRSFAARDGSAVKSHSTILQRLRRQISLDYCTIPPATQARVSSDWSVIEKYISVSEVTRTVVWGGETLTLTLTPPHTTTSFPGSLSYPSPRLLPFIIPFIAVHQSVHRSVGTGRREPWERSCRSRLPLGSLRSPIFFTFSPQCGAWGSFSKVPIINGPVKLF